MPFNVTERVKRMVDAHREQCDEPDFCCYAQGLADAIQLYGDAERAPSDRTDYAAIARRGALHLVKPEDGAD